ncbi:dynein axonemal intermediate chain 3 [Danio aesculapii]|uniref:dynein axonemal intermediate chain 3 n=1 Tax=Danio aesculapii TaxID=1142201 RepID=UPI0024C088BA|nr:dynein axonemal intermediate chain 3 [Danio aesculapii]
MSSKRPMSKEANKKKTKDKNNADNLAKAEEAAASEPGHPEYIFPLVLTSVSQELFGCRADEDVTAENPHKLLKKQDIIQDLRNRAAVCDFSPVKQTVLDYPEDELLLVFDRDFTYGQSFYLVLTVQAKESILKPPAEGADEQMEDEEQQEEEEEMMMKTPEPQPWVSLGSEQEIQDQSLSETRPRLRYSARPLERRCGVHAHFSDRNALDWKEALVECSSYEDKSFSITLMERDSSTQTCRDNTHTSTQTLWKKPKNMWSQYEPREFSPEEIQHQLQSENLKNFITSVARRFEISLQQNLITDVFCDDWTALCEDDASLMGKTEAQLKEYQSFMDLHFSKEKTISHVQWHPSISGLIVVSMMERLSLEERIDSSTKLLLNPSYILFWSFSDPINPQLQLECPDDVLCFQFSPSDHNIIAGGCMNGQVVLWDISAHVDRLQDTQSGGKNIPNKLGKSTVTPVVRYCAVSGIENGHKAPITDIQWLPENFEVNKLGNPVENSSRTSVQLVTCAPDCCVLFWDLRAPRVMVHSLTDIKQKHEEKPLENPHGVPNTFTHLNLTWKPFIRVSLPKISSSGEYSPLKFSMRENTVDYTTGDKSVNEADGCVFAQLRMQSAKQQKPLQNISTKLYIGTEDGELVYTDWKVEKDNDSGRMLSSKPLDVFLLQDTLLHTVSRSPFFRDIILTVGRFSFAIWREGLTCGPLLMSVYSKSMFSAGHWSQSRPAVLFMGREDGDVEVWDLLQNSRQPSHTQNISTASISCIRTHTSSAKQHLLAVSDRLGTLHILQIPGSLRRSSSSERQNVEKYFEKEEERLQYFEKRQSDHQKKKKEMEAEQQKKKTELLTPPKQEEEVDVETLKEYQQFLNLEKLILKDMNIQSETQQTCNTINTHSPAHTNTPAHA